MQARTFRDGDRTWIWGAAEMPWAAITMETIATIAATATATMIATTAAALHAE